MDRAVARSRSDDAVVATDAIVMRVSGLRKRYGRREALNDVSLTIARGELYGLIGPDGAGKSSLMKVVAGVLAFEAGEVQVFGRRIDSERSAESVRDRLGFMPQGLGLNLYPELSIDENIDFLAQLRAVPPDALSGRKSRLLDITRLKPFRDRPVKNLSGGMKQKLALVCTLIHEPGFIVLDEPTTGVDPLSRRDFWRILAELMSDGRITALVSTAYLDEASRFHRASLMYGGQVLAEGPPESLHAPGSACGVRSGEAAGLEEVFIAHIRAHDPQGVPDGRAIEVAPASRSERVDGPAIEAVDLVRDFGRFRAVDRVSFSVARGEILGLLGANGAGKTTVIKMLTGILPPTQGSGRVAGADMRRAGRDIRQRIGYVSQTFSLYADLSVRDNLQLYAGVYGLVGRQARERTEWALRLGGLEAHAGDAAHALPMGLRQRLALACALLHRPQVLFLDEPTSGVDPLGRRRFWSILFALAREEGVAILLTTHHMPEADLCDRVVLMYDGRVADDAAPAAMKRRVASEAGHLFAVRSDTPSRALDVLARQGYADVSLHGRDVHLFATGDEAAEAARIASVLDGAGIGAQGIVPRPLSMEDVFIHRIGRLQRETAAQDAAGGA